MRKRWRRSRTRDDIAGGANLDRCRGAGKSVTFHALMRDAPVYDPAAVETAGQKRWQDEGTNKVDLDHPRRPFFNLMMFPYPSAEGLHVGNMFAFTGADIFGRFRRLQGFGVFEPMGFDAFGIHSENY